VLHTLRVAGGSILPGHGRWQPRLTHLPENTEDQQRQFRQLRRWLMPGYALVARDDLLPPQLPSGEAADNSRLDAWLDQCRLNHYPVADEQGQISWQHSRQQGRLDCAAASGLRSSVTTVPARQRSPLPRRNHPGAFCRKPVFAGRMAQPAPPYRLPTTTVVPRPRRQQRRIPLPQRLPRHPSYRTRHFGRTRMSKLENASVLAFERKLDPSDALFYAGPWEERAANQRWPHVEVREKSVRGTISNRLKTKDQDPLKLDAMIENPNLQTVDVATLPHDADTLKVSFTLRVLAGVGEPSACNKADYRSKLLQTIDGYRQEHGFGELARRYAANLANGRFLWRNRVGAEQVEITLPNGKTARPCVTGNLTPLPPACAAWSVMNKSTAWAPDCRRAGRQPARCCTSTPMCAAATARKYSPARN
jgi:hypothetical protein